LYGVTVSEKAIDSLLELTSKFPLQDLPAPPTRELIVLEGAITSHLYTAQTKPPGLDELKKMLDIITIAQTTNTPAGGGLADKTPGELETLRLETKGSIEGLENEWKVRQKKVSALYKSMAADAELIQKKTAQIADAIAEEEKNEALKKEATAQSRDARKELEAAQEKLQAATEKADKEAMDKALATVGEIRKTMEKIGIEYKLETGKDFLAPEEDEKPKKPAEASFFDTALSANWSSGPVKELEDELAPHEEQFKKNKAECEKLTKNPDGTPPEVTDDDVLAEFSRLSNVPMNKLQEDETEKLLHLAAEMKKYIFGQDEAVDALARAVIRAKAGIKKPNEPIGSFLFLGPSGTGKTETAKVLARFLFGDESALEKFSMENYKDKTSINTLLGSPQGLVGYEEGGKLVNTVRKRPYSVLLFDELEKAFPDIFDTFLAMCDEGVVEDTRGLKAYFGNIVNIMTSNFGAEFLLREDLDFEDAKEMAKEKLRTARDPRTGELVFKPEFLNRLTIICYNRLGEPEILRIADKNLKDLNEQAADKGVSVVMPENEVKKMVDQQYDPFQGGRGIGAYIKDTIGTFVAETIFRHRNVPGVVKIGYTPGELDEEAITKIKDKIEEKTVRNDFADAAGGKPTDDKKIDKIVEDLIKAKAGKMAGISAEFIPADAAKAAAPSAAHANQNAPAEKPALACS
jgi:ATP-dependent Clp protease ATP-binding subunit ClpA